MTQCALDFSPDFSYNKMINLWSKKKTKLTNHLKYNKMNLWAPWKISCIQKFCNRMILIFMNSQNIDTWIILFKKTKQKYTIITCEATTLSSVAGLPPAIQKFRLLKLPTGIVYFSLTSQMIWIAISYAPSQLEL